MAQAQLLGVKSVCEGKVYTFSKRLRGEINIIEGLVLTLALSKRRSEVIPVEKRVTFTYTAVKSLKKVVKEVEKHLNTPGEPYTMIPYNARSKFIGIHQKERETQIALETRTVKDLNLLNVHTLTITVPEWWSLVQQLDQVLCDLQQLYIERRAFCETAGKDLKVSKMRWNYLILGGKEEGDSSPWCFYKKEHALWDAMSILGDVNPDNYQVEEKEQPCQPFHNLMSQVFNFCYLIMMELFWFRDNGKTEVDGAGNARLYFPDGQHRSSQIQLLTEGDIGIYYPPVKKFLDPQNGFLKGVFTQCCLMMKMVGYKYFSPDQLLSEVVQKKLMNESMFKAELFYLHGRVDKNRGEVWLIRDAFSKFKGCFNFDLEIINEDVLQGKLEEILHVAQPSPSLEEGEPESKIPKLSE